MKKRNILLILGAIILATLISFSPLKNAGLLESWDDNEQVVYNNDIKDFSLPGTIKLFKSFYLGMYQPLTGFSYMLENHFGGLNPQVYHATNLILHLLNILLVYWLTKLLFKKPSVALTTAALFALWPTQVEPVAWVSARSTLLASLLMLLTLISYQYFLSQRKTRYYWLSLLLALLAICSKSIAITLLPLVLLMDWYAGNLNKKSLLAKIPLLLIAGGASLLTFIARQRVLTNVDISNGYLTINALVTIFNSLNWQTLKLFWPFNPNPFYPQSISLVSKLPAVSYLHFLPAIGALILAWFNRRHKNYLFFLAWFLFNVCLSICIVPFTNQIGADRYNYLAMLALAWPLALGIEKIRDQKLKLLARLISALVVLIMSFIVWGQSQVWQSNLSLWTYAQSTNVEAWVPMTNLIIASSKQGNIIIALDSIEKSLQKQPDNAYLLINRGLVKVNLANGNPNIIEDAIKDFSRGQQINPDITEAYFSKAQALLSLGQFPTAVEQLSQALEKTSLKDNHLINNIYLNRGFAYVHLKEWSKAEADLSKHLATTPNNSQALMLRGTANINLKNNQAACQDFHEAAKLGDQEAIKLISTHCK